MLLDDLADLCADTAIANLSLQRGYIGFGQEDQDTTQRFTLNRCFSSTLLFFGGSRSGVGGATGNTGVYRDHLLDVRRINLYRVSPIPLLA